MAERERRPVEEERTQQRQRVRQSPSKQLEARDPASDAAVDVPSVETPGVLRDGRFSHPANIGQKARVVSQLQHSHGNAYVQRLLVSRAVQAKLTVNPPDDQYEREADRVAEAVARAPDIPVQRQEEEEEELYAKPASDAPRLAVQRQEQEEEEELYAKPASDAPRLAVQRQEQEEEEEEELYAKPASDAPRLAVQRQEEEEEEEVYAKPAGGRRPVASADLESRVAAQRGRGRPLGKSARASLEPRLAIDLGDVRIHADAEADELSQQLDARAFTTGTDVFFRSGDYQPGTTEGQKLLAHELTHVAQQSEGTPAPAARNTAPLPSARGAGEAPTAAADKGTSVARQEDSDMRIARQPEEVKAEERPATPPPAMPAPPVREEKDVARLAAVRAMWKTAIEDQLKEGSTILKTKGAGKDEAMQAHGKIGVACTVLASMRGAYKGQEPVNSRLYAFEVQVRRLGALLEPHFQAPSSLATIASLADPEGKNLSKLLEKIRAGL